MIIIISGAQGSGKTTLMKRLAKELIDLEFEVHDLIFADTIYKIHNYAINLLSSLGIKRDLVKDGKLLQLLGTEWGRNTISDDIWVECLKGQMRSILEVSNPESKVVFLVSDCRFRNEFDGIPEAFSIRLEASRDVRKARCSQWRDNDTHISEVDLDGYARRGKFTCYIDTEEAQEDVLESVDRALTEWDKDNTVSGIGFNKVSKKYYGELQ